MTTDITTPARIAIGCCAGCGFVFAAELAKTAACTQCGQRMALVWVLGERSEGVPCDGRCMYAIGPNCSCSCEGDNHGRGYFHVEYVPTWVRDRDKRNHDAKQARRAAKREAALSAAADRAADLLDIYPELAELSGSRYEYDYGFMAEMAAALRTGKMTDRQAEVAAAAVRRDIAREVAEAERAAAAAAAIAAGVRVPTGRVTFTGIIAHVKTQPGYAYRSVETKLLIVTAEGWKVWGSLPASLRDANPDAGTVGAKDWYRGRTVTLTATLTGPKDDTDPLFGFYAKPTRATVAADATAEAA